MKIGTLDGIPEEKKYTDKDALFTQFEGMICRDRDKKWKDLELTGDVEALAEVIAREATKQYKNDECYKELPEEEMYGSIGIVCAIKKELAQAIINDLSWLRIKEQK